MFHIEKTSSAWFMAQNHIIAIVVIERRVSIHHLGNNIIANLGESHAEYHTNVSLKPLRRWEKLVYSSQFKPLNHQLMIQQIYNIGASVPYIGNRSKAKIFINQTLNNCIPFTQRSMHLNCPLTVPNVTHFLLGNFIDIGEHSWDVVVSHMLEGKLPKFLIFVGVIFGVIPRVFVASIIAKPNIIPSVCEHEARSLVFVIENPGVRTIEQPMLEDDGLETNSNDAPLSLDPEHGQDIAILGNYLMRLDRVLEVLAVIHKLQFGLWVQAEHTCDTDEHKNQDAFVGHYINGDQQQICINRHSSILDSNSYHKFKYVNYLRQKAGLRRDINMNKCGNILQVLATIRWHRIYQNPSLLLNLDLSAYSWMCSLLTGSSTTSFTLNEAYLEGSKFLG